MEAVNEEMESIQGVTARPDIRDLRGDRDTVDSGPVEPKAGTVNPVPQQLRLVNPVPRGSTKVRESGSTMRRGTSATRKSASGSTRPKPPGFKGWKWKPSGLTGWELYTRKPAISKTGKRSSKCKYLGYYSAEAVRILYAATEKTANARRA